MAKNRSRVPKSLFVELAVNMTLEDLEVPL